MCKSRATWLLASRNRVYMDNRNRLLRLLRQGSGYLITASSNIQTYIWEKGSLENQAGMILKEKQWH
ncbi:MAG: hypothetical protein C4516_03645 [Oxalobacter sp.]|nr:MAG: hypothetical protein C4516_03645 [Oxalobacter sp.]